MSRGPRRGPRRAAAAPNRVVSCAGPYGAVPTTLPHYAGPVVPLLHSARVAGRHRDDATPLERFLDAEFRQVWAVDRETGDSIYLAVGEADQVREQARQRWRCPVPGCDVPITTRGKSRRDHFMHLPPGAAHGEGESEWHLQAKAMIAAWAQHQDRRLTVREEETAKDPDTRMHRIADVMVTWPDPAPHKIAFEVEYKMYTPVDWQIKDQQYRAAGLGCVWLFGHLPRYLARPRKPPHWPDDEPWDRIKWTALTRAAGRTGRPVLFINPVERSIGTAFEQGQPLVDAQRSSDWWRHPEQVGPRLAVPTDYEQDNNARLAIDPIDLCTLDQTLGLVTPTMRWIAIERAEIEAAAAVAREAAERAAAARAAAQAAAEAARATQRPADEPLDPADYARRQHIKDAERWRTHPLRERIIAKRGRIPDFLAEELPYDRGVFADPEHWHCQLFTDLVLGPKGEHFGRTFTMKNVWAMVLTHFQLHKRGDRRGRAIADFLIHLRDHGYLDFTDVSGFVNSDVQVIADFAHPPDMAQVASGCCRKCTHRLDSVEHMRACQPPGVPGKEPWRIGYGLHPTACRFCGHHLTAGDTEVCGCDCCCRPFTRAEQHARTSRTSGEGDRLFAVAPDGDVTVLNPDGTCSSCRYRLDTATHRLHCERKQGSPTVPLSNLGRVRAARLNEGRCPHCGWPPGSPRCCTQTLPDPAQESCQCGHLRKFHRITHCMACGSRCSGFTALESEPV
jgi:hypothetical protein